MFRCMKRLIVVFYIITMPVFVFSAENGINLAKQVLTDLCFENIHVTADKDTLFACFEDPAYRGTFRGPAVAIKQMKSKLPEYNHFVVVVQEYGVSRVRIYAESNDANVWNVSVSYDVKEMNRLFKNDTPSGRNPYGKIDVNLIPIITLNNHSYDKLFEVGAYFAPSIETSLWKGNRLIVQPIIPLYTNLDKKDAHRNVRLGVASVSQELFDCGRWRSKVSAGCFYPDAIGVYGDVEYRVNSYLDIGAHVGYAYTSLFYDNKWYIGHPTVMSSMLTCSVYEPVTSFQLQVAAGRFNFGDWGTRVDLTRHFGEYAIGLYGILTGGEHNGGFHFSIPFGGKKQCRNSVVRLKLPEYYDMQYSMVSFWKYTWERMGREFEEIPDKNHSAHYWQAEYIEKYVDKYLNGKFE